MEMALMRFDTFRDLDRLAQQMFTGNGGPVAARSMPLDAFRRGEQFVINLDLPGVDPASIDLSVEKNVLTVRAERSWSPAEGDEVLITERPQGSFTRQLFLGDNLDTDKVTANYDQGVLCVAIPIAEAAKPRRVQITTGGTNTSIEAGVH
jgi:HSP20 family protein